MVKSICLKELNFEWNIVSCKSFVIRIHYQNMPMQYTEAFRVVKNENFQ